MKKQIIASIAILNILVSLSAAGVVTPTGATASSTYSMTHYAPIRTIDGSGLTVQDPFENSTHTDGGTVASGLYWLSGWVNFSTTTPWLKFDLGADETTTYDISGMLLWNMNQIYIQSGTTYDQTDRGIKDVQIVLSTDSDMTNGDGVTDDWTIDLTLDRGPGSPDYAADIYVFGQTYEGIRFIQFNILSNYGQVHATNGSVVALAEVRFIGEVIPEPATLALLGLGSLGLLRKRR